MCMRPNSAAALKSKAVFAKLELQMNTSKSKLINLWDDKEGFDFLGMHHRKIPNQKRNRRNKHSNSRLAGIVAQHSGLKKLVG